MNRFSVAWILSGILAACLARSVAGQEKSTAEQNVDRQHRQV